MPATPQEGAPTPQPESDAPRFGRRTLLKGAGGVAAAGLVGGGWYVWHSRQPLHTLGPRTQRVERVAFSPDGAMLADAAFDGKVRLWRVSDGQLVRTLARKDSFFRGLAYSPDGERLMAGGELASGAIYQWRAGDGALIGEITGAMDTSPKSPEDGSLAVVHALAYAPDGALIASGMSSGHVYLWRASDGQFVRKMRDPKTATFVDVAHVTFSPDGQILAAGMADGTGRSSQSVLLWRVSDGTLMRTLHVYGTEVTGVSFSPDGQNLLAGAASPYLGGRVETRLWRVRDGDLMGTWEGLGMAAVFGPDGQTFAAAEGRHVQVRRLDSKVVHSIAAGAESVSSIAFSPDGRLLATGSNSSSNDGTVQIWRLH